MSAYLENHAKHKWTILMHVPFIFVLFLLQPINAQIYITVFSLSIVFTPTCFDTSVSSSGSFKTYTSLSYVISYN
jgi:cytochrome c oxidase assembly factor CtaG